MFSNKFRSHQEGNASGNYLRGACATQRRAADIVGFPLGWVAGHQDRPRRDGVDANLRRKRFGKAARKHDDSCLRYAIWDEARPSEQTSDGGEVDDDSPP